MFVQSLVSKNTIPGYVTLVNQDCTGTALEMYHNDLNVLCKIVSHEIIIDSMVNYCALKTARFSKQ